MDLFPTCFSPVLDLNNVFYLFLFFLRSRAAQERLKPDVVEEHKQACRWGKNRPELLHHQQVFLRLTTLPICLPPPVHANPMEPAQGCIGLHTLALSAGVAFWAPTGHACLIVGLWTDHTMALSQVPSQSKETDMTFHFNWLLPKKNLTYNQTLPHPENLKVKIQLQITLIRNTPTQLN